MTDMLPEAIWVINSLKVRKPEDIIEELYHVILDMWDTPVTEDYANVYSEAEVEDASNKQKVLAVLFGVEWYRQQAERIKKIIDGNALYFVKKRAPEGMPQWEFDLLGGEGYLQQIQQDPI